MDLTIEEQVLDILEQYRDKADEAVQKCSREVSSECVTKLKAVDKFADNGHVTGAYSRSWTKKKSGNGYIVYNKDHYQLTHLLENGHVKRGGKGRVPAYEHIRPVEEFGVDEYLNKIKKELER